MAWQRPGGLLRAARNGRPSARGDIDNQLRDLVRLAGRFRPLGSRVIGSVLLHRAHMGLEESLLWMRR
jgi:hypothetical protein